MDSVVANGMNFIHSTDKMAMFHHIAHMPRSKAEDHHAALDVVLQKCNKAGFVVMIIHCDREFKPLMDEVKDNLGV